MNISRSTFLLDNCFLPEMSGLRIPVLFQWMFFQASRILDNRRLLEKKQEGVVNIGLAFRSSVLGLSSVRKPRKKILCGNHQQKHEF